MGSTPARGTYSLHGRGIVKLVEYYVVTVKTWVRVPLPALIGGNVPIRRKYLPGNPHKAGVLM